MRKTTRLLLRLVRKTFPLRLHHIVHKHTWICIPFTVLSLLQPWLLQLHTS